MLRENDAIGLSSRPSCNAKPRCKQVFSDPKRGGLRLRKCCASRDAAWLMVLKSLPSNMLQPIDSTGDAPGSSGEREPESALGLATMPTRETGIAWKPACRYGSATWAIKDDARLNSIVGYVRRWGYGGPDMGRMPWTVLSGGLLVGIAVSGCESCGNWNGRYAGRQPPPGYASATPPASTGMSSWNTPRSPGASGSSVTGPATPSLHGPPTAAGGTGSVSSPYSTSPTSGTAGTSGQLPSGPVVQTRGTTGSAVPPLPPQPNRGISEKPSSYADPVIRTTVPPTAPGEAGRLAPPPPEPVQTPVLGRPDPVAPHDAPAGSSGPRLTPPPAPPLPEPPLPPLPSRPELPH